MFLIPSGEGFMSEGTYTAFQGSSVLWNSMSMAKSQGLRKFERWNQKQYSHSKHLKCNTCWLLSERSQFDHHKKKSSIECPTFGPEQQSPSFVGPVHQVLHPQLLMSHPKPENLHNSAYSTIIDDIPATGRFKTRWNSCFLGNTSFLTKSTKSHNL